MDFTSYYGALTLGAQNTENQKLVLVLRKGMTMMTGEQNSPDGPLKIIQMIDYHMILVYN